jgi:hypothetical protein
MYCMLGYGPGQGLAPAPSPVCIQCNHVLYARPSTDYHIAFSYEPSVIWVYDVTMGAPFLTILNFVPFMYIAHGHVVDYVPSALDS